MAKLTVGMKSLRLSCLWTCQLEPNDLVGILFMAFTWILCFALKSVPFPHPVIFSLVLLNTFELNRLYLLCVISFHLHTSLVAITIARTDNISTGIPFRFVQALGREDTNFGYRREWSTRGLVIVNQHP